MRLSDFQPTLQLDETQRMKMLIINKAFEDLATELLDIVPDGSLKETVLTHLIEAKFLSVHAVTHYSYPSPKSETPAEAPKQEPVPAKKTATKKQAPPAAPVAPPVEPVVTPVNTEPEVITSAPEGFDDETNQEEEPF